MCFIAKLRAKLLKLKTCIFFLCRLKSSLSSLDELSLKVLGYLMLHLNLMASHTKNKMDAKNLATVFSPNLVHSVSGTRRPESLISEMELNNVILEHLIVHAKSVFTR